MKNKERKKVLITFGGRSTEHDISIITAISIYKKYILLGAELILVYVSRDGDWFVGEELSSFKTYKNFDKSKFLKVSLLNNDKRLFKVHKNKYSPLFEIDFVINCFHGGAGEDGRFVGILENNKIPSSASSYKALGIAMDKYLTKMVALSADVDVVDFFSFSYSEWLNNKDRVLQQLMQFDFPVVVKPVNQGSSIGVSFAKTLEEFNASVSLGFKFDQQLIVERAIERKREFNCCLVRTSEGKILAKVDEPVSNKVIISFKDKYLSGGGGGKPSKLKSAELKNVSGMESQNRRAGSGIPSKLKNLIIKQSRQMYEILDMNGVVRFDYIFDTKKESVYLGEINAVPGSLGYYFFDDENLLKLLYDAGKIYWHKKFDLSIEFAPTVF